jgi:hypothetical protein
MRLNKLVACSTEEKLCRKERGPLSDSTLIEDISRHFKAIALTCRLTDLASQEL